MMQNFYPKISVIFLALIYTVWAQLPAGGLPQAGGAARTLAQPCTLSDIMVEVDSTPVPGEKKITISFTFVRKPSNYFNYFLKKPNRIVADFFDTYPRDKPIFVIVEPPLLSCKIETLQVDMNKDIAGLQPDIRSITRVSFLTIHEIHHNVISEGDKIVLTYYWSDIKAKQKPFIVVHKSHWFLWTLLGITGAAGGGTAVYFLTKEEPPVVPAWLPEPAIARPAP